MRIHLDKLANTFKDVEFFVVCVFPTSAPQVGAGDPGAIDVVVEEHFWALSSTARQNGKSLLNRYPDCDILFRGYDSDLAVHTYSDAAEIGQLRDASLLHNGVYAYSKLPRQGPVLVKSDPFGVSPFYHRTVGGCHYFASHPALIHFADDEVNLYTWMSLLQSGFAYGDETFYKDIKRVAAGAEISITRERADSRTWFDMAALPPGEEMIDDASFDEVEAAYAAGMVKLQRLKMPARTLPFSSGYDSRRFFASMLNNKVAFDAVTCQTFHRKKGKYYDIDSHFAPRIAAHFGVDCALVPASPVERHAADNERRLALIGTETFMHDWAVPFMDYLAERPMSIVFDGLAGDTFGNSGYEFDGLHGSAEGDTAILMKETIDDTTFDHVSGLFPASGKFREVYRQFLTRLPANLNRAELVFLQCRTRRCISPWITMMQPPGHVVVFPYYDLGFVRATMKYHPSEKYKWFFQKECLKRSYPAYFDFHGSRNLPADMKPLPAEVSAAMDGTGEAFAYASWPVLVGALKYLSLKNKVLLLASVFIKPLRRRRAFLFRPLLALVKTNQEHSGYLEAVK